MKLELWKSQNGARTVRVYFEATALSVPPETGLLAIKLQATKLNVDIRDGLNTGTMAFDLPTSPWEIPAVLFYATKPSVDPAKPLDRIKFDTDASLRFWKEIFKDIYGQARSDLEAEIQALEKKLSRIECALTQQATTELLGFKAIAGATLKCVLELRLDALLTAKKEGAVFVATFSATLSAFVCKLNDASPKTASFQFRWELTFDGAIGLLPSIQVPDLPGLSIEWPKVDLNNIAKPFNYANFFDNAPDFSRLFSWSSSAFPVTIQKTTGFLLQFSVTNDNLVVTTSQKGSGTIQVSSVDVLNYNELSLEIGQNSQQLAIDLTTAGGQTLQLADHIVPANLTGPFEVVLKDITVTPSAAIGPSPTITLGLKLDDVVIRAKSDPTLLIRLSGELTVKLTASATDLQMTKLRVIEPEPVELQNRLSSLLPNDLFSLGFEVDLGAPSIEPALALLKRIAQLIAEALRWVSEQSGKVFDALARRFVELVEKVAHALADLTSAMTDKIALEFRLDSRTFQLVQIVMTPRGVKPQAPQVYSALGFELSIPMEMSPALVLDLRDHWTALVLGTLPVGKDLTLKTNLWLSQDAAPTADLGEVKQQGQASTDQLITLTAGPNSAAQPTACALVVVKNGQARLLQAIQVTPGPVVQSGLVGNAISLVDGPVTWNDFAVNVDIKPDRILSLFNLPAGGDNKEQYIKIRNAPQTQLVNGVLNQRLEVEIQIPGLTNGATGAFVSWLNLEVNITTLAATIKADKIKIKLDPQDAQFSVLGLDGLIKRKKKEKNPPEDFFPFLLDLNDGNPILELDPLEAELELSFSALSGSGRPLGFSVKEFKVGREGITLDAQVKDEAITLSGLNTSFKFSEGRLLVTRGRVEAFSLKGSGDLPPKLMGEAKASVVLNFAQEKGELVLLACEAQLEKKGDILRCESTRFEFAIQKLGLKAVRQGGYHFYFLLTGYAQFKPNGDEFSSGLLANLSKAKIQLNEAPLCDDPSVLLKHIEFIVPIEPPAHITLFNIFEFEIRGIAFHPASEAFGGKAAIAITGQIKFTDFGDQVSVRCDFHKLWICPEGNDGKPSIRCDGLGLGLVLGSGSEVSGTAWAVDGELKNNLVNAPIFEKGITAKGFLAAGTLTIKGWASIAASMGFLELEKPGSSEKRLAFFIYVQRNEISIPIQTPVGRLYIREVGLGMGYRYTLLGIAAADQAETPRELVRVLDAISKVQGNLSDPNTWAATYSNSAITLAMRALFSINSASDEYKYNAKEEKELPNLVLFDVVAALRTDFTFLMNLRAWISYNYADWREATKKGGESWQVNPNLTGYMYLSAPKREFLARAVYNPGAEVGTHPKLYEPLRKAMKAIRWSSTLYIRPGLFHQEFGWPYELGFSVEEDERFRLQVEGGTILRIEDSTLLYGLAFRARGHIKFEGSSGGDFGASVAAVAEFAVGAKFIAYISGDSSETMLYGAVSLDLNIAFAVHIWWSTRWFSVSAGFCVSLTIHVAAELLIQPAGPAGHLEASVSVGAFGRSLSLGIGFDFGDATRLAMARQRTARFMTLGLGVDYPDPEQGVPLNRPPLPEPPPKTVSIKADAAVDTQAQHRQDFGSGEAKRLPPVSMPGIPIGNQCFSAVFFPIQAKGNDGKNYYLVQLIPSNWHSKSEQVGSSSFYAAPVTWETLQREYVLSDVNGGIIDSPTLGDLEFVTKDGRPVNWKLGHVTWDAKVGSQRHGSGNSPPPNLREFFSAACFLESDQQYELTAPFNITVEQEEMLPDDPADRNAVLSRAARSRSDLGGKWLRTVQTEEARSALVAMVGEGCSGLAKQLRVVDNQLVVGDFLGDFDPRALGLTLVLSEERIQTLFSNPAQALGLKIETRLPSQEIELDADVVAKQFCDATQVVAFNLPEKSFAANPPKLANQRILPCPNGVHLYWDLVPAWGAVHGFTDDPELHLKHYRVERNIVGDLQGETFGTKIFEVKRASTIEYFAKQGAPELSMRLHSSNLQLVDDLSDLSPEAREAILPAALSGKRGTKRIQSNNLTVLYRVLPVDIAGSGKTPVPLNPVHVQARPEQLASFGRCVARFAYSTMPRFEAWPSVGINAQERAKQKSKLLSLYVELLANPSDPHDSAVSLSPEAFPKVLELRLRQDRTIPIGSFGSDSLTQAQAIPMPPDATGRIGANEVPIFLSHVPDNAVPLDGSIRIKVLFGRKAITSDATDSSADEKAETYSISADAWPKFLNALNIPGDVDSLKRTHATRLYIRAKAEGPITPAEFVPVQPQIVVNLDSPPKPRRKVEPVEVTVERFEHPMDVQFQALSDGLAAHAGQLYFFHPAADANFGDSLEVLPLPDVERRTAVSLQWDAMPCELRAINPNPGSIQEIGDQNSDDVLQSLVAGFDLFALNLASIPKGARRPFSYVRPIERVQRLPVAQRGQTPFETGDFDQVEVLYPSKTMRICSGSRGDKPLANWYSASESLLWWPERLQRRSLFCNLEEVALTQLFEKGLPETLEISWELGEGVPIAGGSCAVLNIVKAFQVASSDNNKIRVTKADPKASFRVNDVRYALLSLYLKPDAGIFAEIKLPKSIKVKGLRQGNDRLTGTAELEIVRAGRLHAVLADILDLICYPNLDSAYNPIYRGLKPVIEAPPPIKASSLAGFLDETMPDRDPGGWGILRSLGLAVSFRLFDMDEGEFLDARATQEHLKRAIQLVMPRYQDVLDKIGAPFVNIMATTDVLSELVDPSGAAARTADQKGRILNESLSLIQLELRPVAERLSGYQYSDKTKLKSSPSIGYYMLSRKVNLSNAMELKDTELPQGWVVEIEPILRAKEAQSKRTLLCANWPDSFFPLGNTYPIEKSVFLGLPPQPGGASPADGYRQLAWVRVLRFSEADFPPGPSAWRFDPITDPSAVTPDPKDLFASEDYSPWGRFEPIPGAWLAALHFDVGLPDNFRTPTPKKISDNTLDTIIASMKAMGLADTPPDLGTPLEERDAVQKRDLAGKLGNWAQRFRDHGPAKALSPPSGPDSAEYAKFFGIAFGVLTRPHPRQIAPDHAGRMSVLLFSDDRYGKIVKYAVRPFGRYESLAIAQRTASAQLAELNSTPQVGVPGPVLSDLAQPDLMAQGAFGKDPTPEAAFRKFFVDVSIARSEPLAAPVILSATVDSATHRTDILISRHGHDIAAEANIATDGAIQMRQTAIAFFREFPFDNWLQRIVGALRTTDIPEAQYDWTVAPLEAFGPLANGSDFELVDELEAQASPDEVAHLRARNALHSDLWLGALGIRVSPMPYGFRMLAATHVSAGVVVSPSNAIGIEGSRGVPTLPWAGSEHSELTAWQDRPLGEGPHFDVARTGEEVSLRISWPLARLVDSVDAPSRSVWFGKRAAPEIYRMPDSAWSYQVSIDAEDGSARAPQISLSPIVKASAPVPPSIYALSELGPCFEVSRSDPANPTVPDAPMMHWVSPGDYIRSTIDLRLKVFGPSNNPYPDPSFRPKVVEPLNLSDFQILDTALADWGLARVLVSNNLDWTGAASNMVKLMISPPQVPDLVPPPPFPPLPPPAPAPDWQAFKAILVQKIGELQAYAARPGLPVFVKGEIDNLVNTLRPYAQSFVKDWPGVKNGGLAQPEALLVPWILGMPVPFQAPYLAVTATSPWVWPAGTVETMNAKARNDLAQVFEHWKANLASLNGNPANLDNVGKLIFSAMRRFMLESALKRDERSFKNFKPMVRPLPLAWQELGQVLIDGWPKMPEPMTPVAFDLLICAELGDNQERTLAQIDIAFDTLEMEPGCADTLASLLMMRDDPQRNATVPLRWRTRDQVLPMLKILASTTADPNPAPNYSDQVFFMLFAPLMTSEVVSISQGKDRLTNALIKWSTEMMLGPQAKLSLLSIYGNEKPIVVELSRKLP